MRKDAARNRAAVVAAAARLLDAARDPAEVSMDAVAVAAGVGKGTVFRAVGDREGLLEAVFDVRAGEQYAALRARTTGGTPAERALRLMTEILAMKQRNHVLFTALEETSLRPFEASGYRLAHQILGELFEEAGRGAEADFLAHALLGSVRTGLVAQLRGGPETLHDGLRVMIEALLG